MHSATIAFIRNDLAPWLKGKDPLETERLMHQMLWKFNTRAHDQKKELNDARPE